MMMRTFGTQFRSSAASAIVLAMLSTAAHAEADQAATTTAGTAATAAEGAAAAGGATGAEEEKAELKEIVVTADRKGSQFVQVGSFRGATQLDTPLAISVVGRDLIDTQQASQMADILKNTPGVTMSQTSPTVYSNVAIRGILTENRTNYRMDGFLPVVNLIDMAIEDKERVEALKGASAIYYGFSPPSGIINMVMKRPTRDWMLGVKLFGNDHGRWGVHADMGDTLGIFGYRINAVYDEPDSGIANTHGTRTVIAGAFDIKPTDTLTIQINGEHLYKKVNEPGIWRLAPPAIPTTAAQLAALGTRVNLLPTQKNPKGTIPLPPLLDPNTNFGPDWASNRAEESNAMAKVIWKFATNWELSAAAGFSNLRRDRHFNNVDWTQTNTNPARGPVGEYIMTQLTTAIGARVKNENYRVEVAGAFATGPIEHELLIGAAQLARRNISSSPASLNITCLYSTATATLGQLVGTLLAGQAVPAGTASFPSTQNPFDPHPIPKPTLEMVPNSLSVAKFKDTGI
jgi:iron complex outermembrane receptor protein